MDGTQRKNIVIGAWVDVVQKQDQRTGRLTRGQVARLLTKSPSHPHGIKVMLESGIVGRVQQVIEEKEEA
ncbi:YwbE family protein [Faecalispora anaeroviscerum]|uniref:YwbE family protein n=1 Tax=Faecalispora anaeroviscerum TaxID=2991836 RepID=UPI0024B8DC75|nr:YwbE family protein [Faecalispora anaeroviscerum]